jgi:DNA-binding response OmpR family regulator
VDKLIGLAVGADDYLTKPFSPRELVATRPAAAARLKGISFNWSKAGSDDCRTITSAGFHAAGRQARRHGTPAAAGEAR